jgi:Tfp pilus assembly protein PilF
MEMTAPDELFRLADRQEELGDTAGAMQSWRKLSSIAPRPEVFLRLAHLARSLGHAAEAKRGFQQAIEVDESSTLAYIGLGLIALEAGENREAERLLSKAIRYEEDPVAYCLRGVALRALDQLEEAARSFERAIDIDSAYEEAYFNFGMLLKETNPGRAEQLLKKALEHCPDYAAAHRELGWLLIEIGNRSEADYHLLRAVELKPNDAWAHVYLANNLWARGDVAAATTEYELAATLAPESAFPLWTLANLYEDREEWDDSRRLYVQALEREPDDAVANMNFGRMLKKKGEMELAKRYLLKALSIDPQYHAARHLLIDLSLSVPIPRTDDAV